MKRYLLFVIRRLFSVESNTLRRDTNDQLQMTNYCFVFAVIFLCTSCEQKIQPSVVNQFETNAPSQESWNSEITISDSGRNRAIIFAGYVSVFENRSFTILDSGVIVDFFDEQGHHTSKLTARKGKVNDASKDLEAEGNVVLISDSGTVVETEKLFWNNTAQKVHSQEFVHITSPTEDIRGYGFESDQELRFYKIFRVAGKAKVKEE
ncbi:MAG: LPS export ABC transporter periplasmic protein LptC [Ignavibacteria bacterium]|nr:LPS export ABC transporter periplasmic protein LptC [Ignavibacteria bacterium]